MVYACKLLRSVLTGVRRIWKKGGAPRAVHYGKMASYGSTGLTQRATTTPKRGVVVKRPSGTGQMDYWILVLRKRLMANG
jgi:hypothetical protein